MDKGEGMKAEGCAFYDVTDQGRRLQTSMRILSMLSVSAVLVGALLVGSGSGALSAAENGDLRTDTKQTVFVNSKVTPRKIAVNQPVRVEFTTMPRQVEGVDIAAAVTNGIAITASATWRLVGKPVVTEQEKLKTITVVFSLLPRTTGDVALPSFPLTWLSGEPRPDFGEITVTQTIAIGGETRALPPEYDGVGGFMWGAKQEDLVGSKIPASVITTLPERTAAKVSGSLELGFRAGELADAILMAPGVTLEQARTTFCERWGMPVTETEGNLTWVLGWTRIIASPSADGIKLDLLREDIQAKQSAAQVRGRVFNLLEGVTPK